MEQFLPFFIILVAGIVFSSVFTRIHVPWVIALVIAGVVLGPHALNVVEVNETIEFIAQAGLVFLMFMAGLESKLTDMKSLSRRSIPLAVFNGVIPFLAGYLIGFGLGYSQIVSVLLGIIFVSSSIAIIVPALERTGLIRTELGQSILSSIIIQDIASLVLLSIFLQSSQPLTPLPLVIFYPILAAFVIALLYLLPKIESFISRSSGGSAHELRAIFAVLFGTVIVFELLGLHAIIAGFLAGLVLSKTVSSQDAVDKLKDISYGIFVPTFFVLVGLRTDLSVFVNFGTVAILTIVIVGVTVGSKIVSGYIGGLLVGFTERQSLLFGVSSVPQLSTTLAATFAARSFGFIGEELFTALVILSIVTTLLGPLFMDQVLGRLEVKTKV